MNDTIRRAFKAARARLIGKSWRKKVFLLEHDYPGEITPIEGGVRLNLIDIAVVENSFGFVLDRYEIIRALHYFKRARFSIERGTFLLSIDGVVLNPTTSEELFIISEIFLNGYYNFECLEKSIVIDVGMNVGFASLFFSSRNDVEKVYAFEPLAPTYTQAMINLGLNPLLQNKIITYPYGLDEADNRVEVDYHYDVKGQVGRYGMAFVKEKPGPSEKQIMHNKEVGTEIRMIMERHEGQSLILKLDCEGAEYNIIRRLARLNLLDRIKMLFIEWHQDGPLPIVHELKRMGFCCFYNYDTSQTVGMIYACK